MEGVPGDSGDRCRESEVKLLTVTSLCHSPLGHNSHDSVLLFSKESG